MHLISKTQKSTSHYHSFKTEDRDSEVMEEAGTGDSILDLITNSSYCPANVSLSSIKRGEISSCFIDTVINPLLILVAAAAGKNSKYCSE